MLEKIRPIDHKLKYQIDKLVKTAATGTDANDPANFKANPDNLIGGGDSEESDSDVDSESEVKQKKPTGGVYVPPKLSAVHYTGKYTYIHHNLKYYKVLYAKKLNFIQFLR